MVNKFPLIDTGRMLLRRFNQADIGNVFKALSHPDVIRYYGVSYPTLEATKQQMDWFSKIESEGTGIWWALCSHDDKLFYGAAGLYFIKKEHKKAEAGFWLLPEHWGKGLVVEALKPIMSYGFEVLGLHRIEAFVESENLNCLNVMEKLGFNHEGTMQECEIKHGRFISLEIYARIQPPMVGC